MSVNKSSRSQNLANAALAGQAGCVSLIIIIIALLIGIWLDRQFNQRGPCTVGMLVLSVPFSLYAMVKIALEMVAKIAPPQNVQDVASHDEKEDSP